MPRIGRAVARTAVIAGTATAVSGHVSQKQADKQADKEAGQQAATAPAAEPEVDAPEGRKEAEVVSLDQFRK